MATRTDFYLGTGPNAQWGGSLMFACHPDNLLKVDDGRTALTSRSPAHFRKAVENLLTVWTIWPLGAAFLPRRGWPWAWATSHRNDWIITFRGGPDGGVHMTAGGGDCWHRLDPDHPRPPLRCGPSDFAAWLRNPTAPPAVPLPFYRPSTVPAIDLALRWPEF